MVEKEASSLPPAVVPLGIQACDASSTMATLSADLVETACALESRFSALLAVLEEKLYRDFAALQVQLSGLSLEVASCKVHDDMARLLVPTGSSPSLPGLAGLWYGGRAADHFGASCRGPLNAHLERGPHSLGG